VNMLCEQHAAQRPAESADIPGETKLNEFQSDTPMNASSFMAMNGEQQRAPEAPQPLTLPPPISLDLSELKTVEELVRRTAQATSHSIGEEQAHLRQLTTGSQDHLRKLSEQLQADMRQLLEASDEHSKVLVGVQSSLEKHDSKLEQLSVGKWDLGSLSSRLDQQSARFGRSPPNSGRAQPTLLQNLDLRMPENLEREGCTDGSIRSLLSEPSNVSFRPLGTPQDGRLVMQERQPPTSPLGFGMCCTPQPVVIVTPRIGSERSSDCRI